MITVVGHVIDVLGKPIALQHKLMHSVAKFLTEKEFHKMRDDSWTSNHIIHECVRTLNGEMVNVYYVKSNYKQF